MLESQEGSATKSADDGDKAAAAPALDKVDGDLKSRSRGDAGLYKYFAQLTSTRKLIAWVASMVFLVGVERIPGQFLHIRPVQSLGTN